MSEPKLHPISKPPASKRDHPALSPEYHKARKQLMLWTAILLAWELIGVDLAKIEAAGGNIGALITGIRSPQAIPWVLLLLVAYFLFKTTIEWMQSNQLRREMKVARTDFFSAILFAAISYLLYFGQRIARVQFADLLSGKATYFLAAIAAMPMGIGIVRLGFRIRDARIAQGKLALFVRLGLEQFMVLALISLVALALIWWLIGRAPIIGLLVGVLIIPALVSAVFLLDALISLVSGRPRVLSRL